MRAVWIGLAGAAGALGRYGVGLWIGERSGGNGFPWATFAVNVSGSFVLGLLVTLMTERFLGNPSLRLAVTVGFLGAYTTYATFALESVRLAEDGALGLAALNVLGSVVAGTLAVIGGIWLGRTV